MKTKAAVVYEKEAPFVIEELELAAPKQGEVLVELVNTGICRTDNHAWDSSMSNPFPAVLGHEGAGIVREVGPGVTTCKVGDHVVTVWMPSCGKCEPCRSGMGNICVRGAHLQSGTLFDGKTRFKNKKGQEVFHWFMLSAFSQFIVVPEESAVPVNKEAPFEKICLLGCALTAGFGAATRTAMVEAGATAALWGFGGIGAGVLNGLKASTCRTIIVVDPLDWKEEPARKMGATHFINPLKEDPVEKIKEITWGRGVDYAFECWGGKDATTQAQCYHAIKNRGKAVYLGGPDKTVQSLPVDCLSFCLTDKTIVGSLYGWVVPLVDVPKFVDLYMAGKMDLDTPVSQVIKLEDINKGFDDMRNGRVIRSVIRFD